MLKTACIHPEIMHALSLCGHGDQLLIADGNYPLASCTGNAQRIYLGLTAGVPQVTQVLEVLGKNITIESAAVMMPENNCEPAIFKEFRQLTGGLPLEPLSRSAFYEACGRPSVKLAISTGEQRVYANILITVGVA